jgi:hypothetical protein
MHRVTVSSCYITWYLRKKSDASQLLKRSMFGSVENKKEGNMLRKKSAMSDGVVHFRAIFWLLELYGI